MGKPKRFLCGQTAAEFVKSQTCHRSGQFARINQYHKVSELVDTRIPGSQFTSIISQSKLFSCSYLNIPSLFLASVDLSSICRMIVADPEGQQWPVNVYHSEQKMKHKATIGYGWKAFCASNNVEIGDVCNFKLASRVKNDVFHVSIVKQKVGS